MKRFLLTTVALAALIAPAVADTFFGHRLEVVEGNPGEKRLLLDDRSIIEDGQIIYDCVELVGTTPVIIGSHSCGGNMCGKSTFVISFPVGGKPQVDEADTGQVDLTITATTLEFVSAAPKEYDRGRWTWSQMDGFKQLSTLTAELDPETGWEAIRERAFGEPSDVFLNATIVAELKTLLAGRNWDEFEPTLRGLGTGKYINGDYFAVTCRHHDCGWKTGFLYLSAKDHKIYVAWQPFDPDAKVEVAPNIKNWPKPIRAKLKTWTRDLDSNR